MPHECLRDKFTGLIELTADRGPQEKRRAIRPRCPAIGAGDNYEEIIENVNRIAETGLMLGISGR